MLKSELVERISSQNPHLYQRDIEKIVNAILDEIVGALRRALDVVLGPCLKRLQNPAVRLDPQSSHWCCRRGRKESCARLQDGKRNARAA